MLKSSVQCFKIELVYVGSGGIKANSKSLSSFSSAFRPGPESNLG